MHHYVRPPRINNYLLLRLGYMMYITSHKPYIPPPTPYTTPFKPNQYQPYQCDDPNRHYAVQYLTANELFVKMFHMYNEVGNKASLDSLLNGSTSDVWGNPFPMNFHAYHRDWVTSRVTMLRILYQNLLFHQIASNNTLVE